MPRAPLLLPCVLACAACADPTDLSCTAWLPPRVTGVLRSRDVAEVSGLVASRRDADVMWTLEDSGSAARLVAWTLGGGWLAELPVDAERWVDAEALAAGACGPDGGHCLYAGDIGDNLAVRDSVNIQVVEEPPLDGSGNLSPVTRSPRFTRLAYEDGPQDAEAMVVDRNGHVVVFTKRTDGTTRVYRSSVAWEGTGTLVRVEELDVAITGRGSPASAVTDAALSADGTRLLLRMYAGAWEWNHPEGVLEALGEAQRNRVPSPPELQGEAVAYAAHADAVMTVAEGPVPLVWTVQCAFARADAP